MGSKVQRQNRHVKRLDSKIRRWKKKSKNTDGLEKELGYCMGEKRPEFATGKNSDPRMKKRWNK